MFFTQITVSVYQNNNAGKVLYPLQQVGHFLIGMAVVGGGRGGALAEEGVRFVEEEDPVAVLC